MPSSLHTLFLGGLLVGLASAQTTCTGRAGLSGLDVWCQENCAHDPPFCPVSLCECSASTTSTTPTTISANEQTSSCCVAEDQVAFVGRAGSLSSVNLAADGSSEGQASLCGTAQPFLDVVDIVSDNDGGVFVADGVKGTVYYVSPNCASTSVVYSWQNQQLPAPRKLAVRNGKLLVVTNPMGLIEITLDASTLSYHSHTVLVQTNNEWNSIQVDAATDTAFLTRGGVIIKLNLATLTQTTFLTTTLQQISDLALSPECGLYFVAPADNQLWHCSDINDHTSCGRYCRRDSWGGCKNLWTPHGVALDCNCNALVTTLSGGLLVKFAAGDADTDGQVLLSGLHAKTVDVFSPHECTSASVSPSLQPSPSPSKSPNYDA